MCGCEIYFREGTHSPKKGISYHSLLSQYLGTSACDVLPAFHALTGCNNTYRFHGCFKYGSFKIMLKKKRNNK